MAEINNNITKFGLTSNKVDTRHKDIVPQQPQQIEESVEQHYVQDTGVLGRSQVKSAKNGGNIAKSVDEAILFAKQYPTIMQAGDKIFNTTYDSFIKAGLSEEEAYENATLAVEEFCEISLANIH